MSRLAGHVVICLKNRTFAVSQTTWTPLRTSWWCCDLLEKSYFCSIANNRANHRPYLHSLWFAWKIVLLQYRKQRSEGIFNVLAVVICLKNRTFAVSQTTAVCSFSVRVWLWFAWKIVLLQYRKQRNLPQKVRPKSCDLLEKSYFCSIANNKNSKIWTSKFVVICLKNRTFAVSQTTISNPIRQIIELWFAWKIVLLQYRKQLIQ